MFLLLQEAHPLLVDHAARDLTRYEDTCSGVGFWCYGNHGKLIFLEAHQQPFPPAGQDLSLITGHCSLCVAGEENAC